MQSMLPNQLHGVTRLKDRRFLNGSFWVFAVRRGLLRANESTT
jgi:hypothetical protein